MNDLDRQLGRLDDLGAPDLRSRIGRPPYGDRQTDGPTRDGRVAAIILATVVAVAGIGFAIAGLQPIRGAVVRSPADQGLERPSTYVFSDIVAGPSRAEPDDLAVTFTVSWSTDAYPGVHICRFVVYRADGSILGEVVRYSDWRPGRWYHDVPGDPRDAASGEVTCDAERLDVPGIGDVEPIPLGDGTTSADLSKERERRLSEWAEAFDVDEMPVQSLAGNLWAVRSVMSQKAIVFDFTEMSQLSDRMRYLCVRLPEGHQFRGGEFCD
jgi:hypothetical protein